MNKLNKPKLIRNISGFILALDTAALIIFFGIMPLLKLSAWPVLKDKQSSVYAKGSLAFTCEAEPDELKSGSVIVYYQGDTPIGSRVETNDKENAVIYASANGGETTAIPYRKVSGRGVFSVPWLGSYADWLINGAGLAVSTAILGVIFVIFAVSAIMTREE